MSVNLCTTRYQGHYVKISKYYYIKNFIYKINWHLTYIPHIYPFFSNFICYICICEGDIPSLASDGRRLQMIVCSATLHNFEVKKLAEKLMYFPSWVDLKGLDSVPDTIHHCVCVIDPSEDREWRSLRRHVATDGVHATDRLNRQQDSKEMFSEAVKILKAEYCVRAIEKYNMDKALIFCRTKLDCDNLEVYLRQLNRADKFSCKFRCIKDFLSK